MISLDNIKREEEEEECVKKPGSGSLERVDVQVSYLSMQVVFMVSSLM